jgi:hypothetical protein
MENIWYNHLPLGQKPIGGKLDILTVFSIYLFRIIDFKPIFYSVYGQFRITI